MPIDVRDNRTRSRRGTMQLSVGPDGGDLRSNDNKVLQAGIEYLVRDLLLSDHDESWAEAVPELAISLEQS
jgi:hypothetical protein